MQTAFEWMGELDLRNLLIGYDQLPATGDAFDERHRIWRNALIAHSGNTLSHGKAAKLINVYLKAAVVCASCQADGQVPEGARCRIGAIHPPIDRILLRKVPRRPDTDDAQFFSQHRAWTEFTGEIYEAVICRLKGIAQYLEPDQPLEFWRLERFWLGY